MTAATTREIVASVLDRLPQDATLEQVARELEFIAGVREGFAQLDRGEGISLETIEQMFTDALGPSGEERAHLADRLVESLDTAEVSRLDRLWATEGKRRRDEVRQGLVQTIPGDEALARVRRSLGR